MSDFPPFWESSCCLTLRATGFHVRLFTLSLGNSDLIWANNEQSKCGHRAACLHTSVALTPADWLQQGTVGVTRGSSKCFPLKPSNLNTWRPTWAEDHTNSGNRTGNIYWLQNYNVKLKSFPVSHHCISFPSKLKVVNQKKADWIKNGSLCQIQSTDSSLS